MYRKFTINISGGQKTTNFGKYSSFRLNKGKLLNKMMGEKTKQRLRFIDIYPQSQRKCIFSDFIQI